MSGTKYKQYLTNPEKHLTAWRLGKHKNDNSSTASSSSTSIKRKAYNSDNTNSVPRQTSLIIISQRLSMYTENEFCMPGLESFGPHEKLAINNKEPDSDDDLTDTDGVNDSNVSTTDD